MSLPRFTPEERAPCIHCIGGWVGPRAGLDAEVRGKILCLCRGSNPGHLVRSQTLYWLGYPGSLFLLLGKLIWLLLSINCGSRIVCTSTDKDLGVFLNLRLHFHQQVDYMFSQGLKLLGLFTLYIISFSFTDSLTMYFALNRLHLCIISLHEIRQRLLTSVSLSAFSDIFQPCVAVVSFLDNYVNALVTCISVPYALGDAT
jgi:hypothetical protein